MRHETLCEITAHTGQHVGSLHVDPGAGNDADHYRDRGVLVYDDVDGNGTSEVLIDDVIIVPPPGFDALQYPEGQQIIIVGTLLADNRVQTISFIRADPTPEPRETAGPAATPTLDSEADDDGDDEEDKQQEEREREEERRSEEVDITGDITSVTQNTIVVNGETIEGGGSITLPDRAAGSNRISRSRCCTKCLAHSTAHRQVRLPYQLQDLQLLTDGVTTSADAGQFKPLNGMAPLTVTLNSLLIPARLPVTV